MPTMSKRKQSRRKDQFFFCGFFIPNAETYLIVWRHFPYAIIIWSDA